MTRRTLWLLTAGAAIAVVVLSSIAYFNLSWRDRIQTLSWPQHFSTAAWSGHPQQRRAMAVDLERRGLLIGKPTEWLVENLGGPANGAPAGERDGGYYWNVPSPQNPNDMLVVLFRDGSVVHAEVTADPEGQ